MSCPAGPWYIDDLLTFAVDTHDTDGNAVDADSAPTYRVYEDETGTPILTGTMATRDASNTDGHYSEQITLSAANGFEVGKTYGIRVAATVDSVAAASTDSFKVIATPSAGESAEGIAEAVWAALLEDHYDEGSFGEAVAAILAKVINLPADPADASDIAALLAAIGAVWKKNTALDDFTFGMEDASGPATGLTVTAVRSIDGAAAAPCANAVTEVGGGLYKLDLAATDLNGRVIAFKFTAPGAKARMFTVITQD